MQHIDTTGAEWFKSSYSGQGGECVEVTSNFPGLVPVRDSKDPDTFLLFPSYSWQSFVSAVQDGEFGAI